MLLWQELAHELGERCGTSTTRDYQTVARRVEEEGFSFLTITLPQLCKDFERSLDNGCLDSRVFCSFKKKPKTGLPSFLWGFLSRIFDTSSGLLLDSPDIDSIHAVRQLTLLYSKVELPTTEKRLRQAMKGFINVEAEISQAEDSWSEAQVLDFERISGTVWNTVLREVNSTLYDEHRGPSDENVGWPFVYPKHGPGATADRLSGNEKFDVHEWPERLESVFPYLEYAVPNHRHHDRLCRVDFREPGTERPVRVIAVPKSMKSPRIIAIEPTAMQYMQQGVKDLLVGCIEADPVMGRIVGFSDQHVNREMAQKGSDDGSLATLDLSEASDRVSYSLVAMLTRRFPMIREAFDATRSRRADVRDEGILSLSKYASMGSALTFPVEAMVFTTVVFYGIEKALGRPLTSYDVKSMAGMVRVYGDDIIVPVEYVHSVVESLELFGFKVNSSKSFWTGKYRESCGREFYDGQDVSVVKVRRITNTGGKLDFPTSRQQHGAAIESFVMLRNNFYIHGCWRTAAWLDRKIDSLFGGLYPTIEVTYLSPEEGWGTRSPLLGRWSFLGYQAERTHLDYQKPLCLGYVAVSKIPPSLVSEIGALQKVLSQRGEEPFDDPTHLHRAGRPRAVRIKRVYESPA